MRSSPSAQRCSLPLHAHPRRQGGAASVELVEAGAHSSALTAGRVHLAVADDAIVGVSETGEMDGEQVIWKLYLAPASRGRSLGVELLRQAIAALPGEPSHVLVEHVAGNTRAGAFYEREGFAVVHTRR